LIALRREVWASDISPRSPCNVALMLYKLQRDEDALPHAWQCLTLPGEGLGERHGQEPCHRRCEGGLCKVHTKVKHRPSPGPGVCVAHIKAAGSSTSYSAEVTPPAPFAIAQPRPASILGNVVYEIRESWQRKLALSSPPTGLWRRASRLRASKNGGGQSQITPLARKPSNVFVLLRIHRVPPVTGSSAMTCERRHCDKSQA